MRNPLLSFTFAGLALTTLLAGCDFDAAVQQLADQAARQRPSTAPRRNATTPTPVRRDGSTVKVSSFNIQVFGSSKEKKGHVMEVLADVVRRFDVVAIQEVRTKDRNVIPRFVELVNASGANYDYVIGPRLGRTSSKEQYVFVFDTARIELDRSSVYTASDPRDLLHREPLVATFRVRAPPGGAPFSFTLVNIHTDPDDTKVELDALGEQFVMIQEKAARLGEDDVIVLGDLNVNERKLGKLGRLPGIAWAISGQKTNTRRTKAYDNLIFDGRATVEYSGDSGVLDLMAEFGLTQKQALEVSDHLPVWAEFSVHESRPGTPLAEQPGRTAR